MKEATIAIGTQSNLMCVVVPSCGSPCYSRTPFSSGLPHSSPITPPGYNSCWNPFPPALNQHSHPKYKSTKPNCMVKKELMQTAPDQQHKGERVCPWLLSPLHLSLNLYGIEYPDVIKSLTLIMLKLVEKSSELKGSRLNPKTGFIYGFKTCFFLYLGKNYSLKCEHRHYFHKRSAVDGYKLLTSLQNTVVLVSSRQSSACGKHLCLL